MRKINTKMELAKKNNTRVVFCNVPETILMLELVNNIDKIYKHIRKNSGFEISIDKSEKHRKDFLFLAANIEKYLANLAEELNLQDFKKSHVLQTVSHMEENK
jgi:transcription initiation factor TFIIIB Brf1 subunit/transcription initiation factor TFIIB